MDFIAKITALLKLINEKIRNKDKNIKNEAFSPAMLLWKNY